MSDKQQDIRSVRTILILIIAALVGGIIWYVAQAKDNTDKTLNDTRKVQQNNRSTANNNQYKGWKSYTWASQKLSLKYPGAWVVEDNASQGRLYLKNKQVDLLKEETPADFLQIWLSHDLDEASKAREDQIKQGQSDFRVVDGAVKASTIKAGGRTVNVYEYDTLGGPTLEAYFTNKAGTRLFATTSTEVGEKNQQEMVATLKKMLSSLSFLD